MVILKSENKVSPKIVPVYCLKGFSDCSIWRGKCPDDFLGLPKRRSWDFREMTTARVHIAEYWKEGRYTTKQKTKPPGIFKGSSSSNQQSTAPTTRLRKLLEARNLKNYFIELRAALFRAHAGLRIFLILQPDWEIM